VCDGTNSTACSYDYGWNYAKDAFARARAVTATAPTLQWWLDVETGNSWQTLEAAYGQTPTAQTNDRESLAGAVAALHDSGVARVGVYSTSYQWGQIAGTSGSQFAEQPVWVAGVGSLSTAQANCRSVSFTGGRVTLSQYANNGYDADYHC
jgi:GH25 family lysozyme M1 (1,4-beta-N-acetylmuramidase)